MQMPTVQDRSPGRDECKPLKPKPAKTSYVALLDRTYNKKGKK